jgi:hypothetical protein
MYLDGVWSLDSSLVSVSSSTDKFKLSAYSLKPSSVYVVRVVSTVKVNPYVTLTSSSSVTINVQQSSLVSKISGGSSQMVRQGEVIVLDGTGSYDPDVAPTSSSQVGLSSEWSCTSPSSSCVVSVSSFDPFIATVSPSPLSEVGTIYEVVLKVKDLKNVTRMSQASVFLTITTPNSPKITVARSTSSRLNPQDSLSLSGSVQLYVPNTLVRWSVNDELLNTKLSSISGTVVRSSSLAVGVNQFNLLIFGGQLPWKSEPYVFTLSAGDAMVSISVLLNRAPYSGQLVSDPTSGVVLDTIFRLSVSGWVDEEGDLPLTYEFYSMSNGKNFLKGRSEMLFAETMLPLGSSSNNFLLDCWVGVYDSLGANSSSSVSVRVGFSASSSSISSSSLLEKSTTLLSTTSNADANSVSSDRKLQVVSLLSSILNWKDCSLVPTPCSDLNRNDCSSTINTCGSCLPGYFGVSGDDNSLCVDESSFQTSVSNSLAEPRSCDSNSNCESWESCASGVCVMKSKSCKVSDCSGHGECQFVISETRDKVSVCGLLDNLCEAICVCESQYSGDNCDMSSSEMSNLRAIRSQMVAGLLSVAADNSDVDEGGLLSVLSSLSSVTRSPSELSLDSGDLVLEVLSVSLGQARSLDLSYSSLSTDVLSSLNSVAMTQVRDSSNSSFSSDLLNVLGTFTEFVAGQLVVGQSPIDSVNSMFRTRVQPLSFSNSDSSSSGSSIDSSIMSSSIPQSQTEILSLIPSTSFSLVSSTTSEETSSLSLSLSLVSTSVKSSLVDLSTFSLPLTQASSFSLSTLDVSSNPPSALLEPPKLTSNLLKLQMLGSHSSSVSSITVVLPTIRSQSYPVYESEDSVTTTCEENDFHETVHVCHGELGDVNITHRCQGTAMSIVSKCPRQSLQPSCSTGESSTYHCSVLSHTSTSVTCVCDLLTDGVGRSLSALSDSGMLEVRLLLLLYLFSLIPLLSSLLSSSGGSRVLCGC